MRFLVIAGALAVVGCRDLPAPPVDAAGAGETPCGALTCASSEYCDYESNSCGAVGEPARCVARTSCASSGSVCGCDGAIHSSECSAHTLGLDVDANFRCPKPAGQFTCGYTTCNLATQVCASIWKGTGPLENSTFSCIALPGQCTTTPTCGCVFANIGGTWSGCGGDASTGFRVYYAPAVR